MHWTSCRFITIMKDVNFKPVAQFCDVRYKYTWISVRSGIKIKIIHRLHVGIIEGPEYKCSNFVHVPKMAWDGRELWKIRCFYCNYIAMSAIFCAAQHYGGSNGKHPALPTHRAALLCSSTRQRTDITRAALTSQCQGANRGLVLVQPPKFASLCRNGNGNMQQGSELWVQRDLQEG
jgi:hypothetical protein